MNETRRDYYRIRCLCSIEHEVPVGLEFIVIDCDCGRRIEVRDADT